MKNITFKQYRNIDLSIFAVLLIVSEAITTVATNTWFASQPVAISTTALFISIVMMRWDGWAAIHATIGGAVFCIASGATPTQFAIYVLGNSLSLLALVWFRAVEKERIRKSAFLTVFFTVSVYLLLQVGRWLVSLCFGGSVWNIAGYISSDIISLLFAAVIMLLLRKTDGIIEDQKAYLFRQMREREAGVEAAHAEYSGYGSED